MINECGAADRIKTDVLGENQPQCHFVYHKLYKTSHDLGLNMDHHSEKPETNCIRQEILRLDMTENK
jgi:hypothetical protein